MAKLGVITDGISRDLEHALQVATEYDLEYAELQYVWDKQVGDFDDDQMAKALALVAKYGVKVSSITRHNFVGLLVGEVEVGDAVHQEHMAALQRCIDMAKAFDTKIVRTMSFRKEMIIFGYNGAEDWNASRGAWDKLIELLTPAVKLAEANDIILSVETGNNAMIPRRSSPGSSSTTWAPTISGSCGIPPTPSTAARSSIPMDSMSCAAAISRTFT